MTTRTVDEPGFAAETETLLARLGSPSPITSYPALLAARAEARDPAVSDQPDLGVYTVDLYLRAHHGPIGAR